MYLELVVILWVQFHRNFSLAEQRGWCAKDVEAVVYGKDIAWVKLHKA